MTVAQLLMLSKNTHKRADVIYKRSLILSQKLHIFSNELFRINIKSSFDLKFWSGILPGKFANSIKIGAYAKIWPFIV